MASDVRVTSGGQRQGSSDGVEVARKALVIQMTVGVDEHLQAATVI